MHSRQSIPNVGRRAPGSRSLFVLQGTRTSGIRGDQAQGSLVHQAQGSLVHQAQGNLVHQAQANHVHQAQGSLVHQAQGSLVHQAHGSLVHQAQGNHANTAQGSLVHQAQGSLVNKAQSNLVHQAQGSLVHKAHGSLVHQAQGSLDHRALGSLKPDVERYAGSLLGQPHHPYHGIIQRILQRHQNVAHRHRMNGSKRSPRQQDHGNDTNQQHSETRTSSPLFDADSSVAQRSDTKSKRTERGRSLDRTPRRHNRTPRERDRTHMTQSTERGRSLDSTPIIYDTSLRTHSIDRWRERSDSGSTTPTSQGRADTNQGGGQASTDIPRRWSQSNAPLQSRKNSNHSNVNYENQPSHHPHHHPHNHNHHKSRKNSRCSVDGDHYQQAPLPLDLRLGSVTDRSPRFAVGDDGSSSRLRVELGRGGGGGGLDTTRSEPGGGSSATSQARVAKPRLADPIDDLLDYMWVYQGMGRQVLNLELSTRDSSAWNPKVFKKHSQLPPIHHGLFAGGKTLGEPLEVVKEGSFTTSATSHRKDSSQADDSVLPVGVQRRAISEPDYRTGTRSDSTDFVGLKYDAEKDNAKLKKDERTCVGRRIDKGLSVDIDLSEKNFNLDPTSRVRRGPMKLVVMMPEILTQEMTCVDLFEKE